MGSNYYPWGPHGPQGGPNQVTPNPTPAYEPPPAPSGGSWGAPAPQSYGGYQGSYTPGAQASAGGVRVYQITPTPGPKHYWLAVILAFVFGPLGLFYASKKGALIMLVLLVGVPIGLGSMGYWGPAIHRHPLSVLDHSSVMDGMWSTSVFFSLIWSVIGVRRYNKAMKARRKVAAAEAV